jgi:hypothetical protein
VAGFSTSRNGAIPGGADGIKPRAAGTLATQDCKLVAESYDFEFQFHTAAKPVSEPAEDRRDVSKHSGDFTVQRTKSLGFSTISKFLVGTDRAAESRNLQCSVSPALLVCCLLNSS